jgi:hypothetical protein
MDKMNHLTFLHSALWETVIVMMGRSHIFIYLACPLLGFHQGSGMPFSLSKIHKDHL